MTADDSDRQYPPRTPRLARLSPYVSQGEMGGIENSEPPLHQDGAREGPKPGKRAIGRFLDFPACHFNETMEQGQSPIRTRLAMFATLYRWLRRMLDTNGPSAAGGNTSIELVEPVPILGQLRDNREEGAMHDVLLQIKEYLAMRDIRFAEQSEDCLMVPIQGQACSFQVRVSIDDDTPDQVTLAAWASVIVPEGARRSVAETACRVNAGLRMGRCELDFDAGYMGFFVSQYVAEELQGERLDHLFQLTAWTLDLYVAAALSVVYGNEPPADAVRAAKIAAGVLSVDDEDEASDDRDESPHD